MMSGTTLQNKQVKEVESFLICTYKQAQTSSKWKFNQSIELQLFIDSKSKEKYFELVKKYKDTDKSILSLVANLIISHKAHDTYKKMHRKNANFVSNDLILVNLLEKNKFINQPRIAKKEQYLRRILPQLLNWRSNGDSYREISKELKNGYGQMISHEYIRNFLNAQREI